MLRTRRRGPALRFRLFGTPIRIGLSFPIAIVALPLLFGGRLGHDPVLLGAWLALVTVSVLVHEFGHVAALRAFGFRPDISLNAMGGLTSTEENGYLSPLRSVAVSLAGPATAIAFGITVEMALLPIGGRTIEWLRAACWFVNIWWSAFNLLPITPLDGGHVAREFVEYASRRRGGWTALLIAVTAAVSIGAWIAFGDDQGPLVVIGIALMIGTNIGAYAITEKQHRQQSISIAHEQLMRGELDAAIDTLLPIAWSPEAELIPDEAYTLLAWALLHERRFHELSHLDPARFHDHHRRLLSGAVAWYRGDVDGAYSLVSEALATGPVDPPDTYFNRVFGRLGELDRLGQHISLLPFDASMRAGVRFRDGVTAAAATA
ncbi:MAG: hypothetical protein U0Q22_08620 [Acidimicrobiales bacterium]